MKKIHSIIYVIILLSFTSCFFPYGEIIYEEDDYKGIEKLYIVFDVYANPSKTNYGYIYYSKKTKLKFEKLVYKDSQTIVGLKIYTSAKPEENMENYVYIKTNKNIHKLKINLLNSTYTNNDMTYRKDTTIEIKNNNLSSYISKRIEAKIILPDNLICEISFTDVFNIRYYIDDIPYDVTLNHERIKKLKKLLINYHI